MRHCAVGYLRKSCFLGKGNGYRLNKHVFRTEAPAAAVQVIHGAEENQDQYGPFAELLTENRICITPDK